MKNNQLDEVNNWILSNTICINAEKTRYILFSYTNTAHLPPISIDISMIEKSS